MTADKFILKVLNGKFPFVVDVKNVGSNNYYSVDIYVDYNKLKEYAQIPDEYILGMNNIMNNYKDMYNENYSLHHLSSILDDTSKDEIYFKLEDIGKIIKHLIKRLGETYMPKSLIDSDYIDIHKFIFV
jgi:hypothetical protein